MDGLSTETFVEQLSQAGYRITQPRLAVIRAMLEDKGYSRPYEIHERAASYCPSVGLVTVYRTLDLMVQMGLARRIHTDDGCHSYVVTSNGHRHHLVCRQCGATVEFDGCDLSAFLARVSRETGYQIDDHLLELVGLCSACR
jgi:Fur family ferric uptake transcriptional regulator